MSNTLQQPSVPAPRNSPLRIAVITWGVSHFEVPLFRLCHSREDVELMVFYCLPVKQGVFDTEYKQKIDWGGDLLAGYNSHYEPTFSKLVTAIEDWGADVSLIYGYSWPGISLHILQNRLKGHAQIHRGTLNYHRDPRRPIRGRLQRPIGRLLLALFDAHHYGGTYSKKVLLDAGAKQDSLFYVPFSIDTPYFLRQSSEIGTLEAAEEIRRKLGWGSECQVVLYIAQLNWFKGPDIAIETFARLAETHPTMRFLVLGSGRMGDEMRQAAAKTIRQQHIHFAGFVASLDTPKYYLASDLVLCSSRYETWARMLNEAMLCRCPAVISELVPAAGDLVIDGDTGHVVVRPTVEELSAAVYKHFQLPVVERNAMRDRAQERAKLFGYDGWVDNVVASASYAASRKNR